jgi:cardiolipin synthase A/B
LQPAPSQRALVVEPGRPVPLRTAHHEVILYPDPGPFFAHLEHAIDGASRRVWLETYIYRNDRMGGPFAERLAAAARRGIDVRLLYDPQGSRGSTQQFFDGLRSSGVGVRAYRPWQLARKRWTYWPRDHGRIVVVDDTAHTGGINWGVEWLPRDRGGDEWHDVTLGVRGPAVDDFEAVFLRRWAEASDTDEISDYVAADDSDVQLIADSPAHTSVMLQRLCGAISRAEERVWMENSYCVPPRILLAALSAATRRGVDVQLIVPGESDLPSLQAVTRGEYLRWIESGIQVSEYLPRVMHSKFALVDDDWSTVGTFNAISPGVWWANETNVIVRDRGFVAELASVFRNDISESARVSASSVSRRPWPSRARNKLLAVAYRVVERLILLTQRDLPALPPAASS